MLLTWLTVHFVEIGGYPLIQTRYDAEYLILRLLVIPSPTSGYPQLHCYAKIQKERQYKECDHFNCEAETKERRLVQFHQGSSVVVW